ncbi:LLM class flavin-dependent oxidoreductase [Streptosporangium sp. NPDC000396]|uniref:LLM class flavin-dependent oxidoreductase n=1 Tax=Streptosporangium sp. NPDC000396 TaxID=3366185 RepID=UPI0036793078
MSKFSVLTPFMPMRSEQVVSYAALVQASTAHRLWQGQSMLAEPHQSFAYAAAMGLRIPVGTGVTLMPFRHPLEAVLQARSLAAVTSNPVVAGFGPGGTSAQMMMYGKPYKSPLTACREYLTIVRGLLDGDDVVFSGDYFSFHGSLPVLPGPPVEIGLGVLRPGMARLAGELADVAITWLTPPGYLRDCLLPALREGAAAAGRTAPRVAAIVPVALGKPGRDPVKTVLASNQGHLQGPHYQDMLRRAGVAIDTGDLATGAQALLDENVFVSGEMEDLAKGLDAYRQAGVDEIVLNVTGVFNTEGGPAALSELATILTQVS